MMRSAQFILALTAMIYFGAVLAAKGKKQERTSCTGTTPVCDNCQTHKDCSTSPVTAINCTSCGMVCGENDASTPYAACYSGYDNIDPSQSTNGYCICKDTNGNNLLNGAYQDPYDATAYINCLNGEPTYDSCAEGEIYYEITKGCVSGADCEGQTSGYIEDPLQCNTYIDCNFGGIRDNCNTPDLVFDEDTQMCIDPMDTACDGANAGTISAHGDVCYMYVLCTGSPLELNEAYCCPRGQYFDQTGCVDGLCTFPPLCIQEYWEQLYCNQCNSNVTAYPTREICSSFYYECEDDGNGGTIPSLAECPETYPIFNPVSLACDVASNVIECSYSTTVAATTGAETTDAGTTESTTTESTTGSGGLGR